MLSLNLFEIKQRYEKARFQINYWHKNEFLFFSGIKEKERMERVRYKLIKKSKNKRRSTDNYFMPEGF